MIDGEKEFSDYDTPFPGKLVERFLCTNMDEDS